MGDNSFRFKKFVIQQDDCTMKVNTDGVLLGAWSDISTKKNVLDIGTGTGVIAIMVAQKNEEIIAHGLEIDEIAYKQARLNMEQSPFSQRLEAIYDSLQNFCEITTHKYDLIISNPPFFSGGTFSLNENKKNVRHTIKLSHTDLLRSVKKLLTPDGHFDLILPYIEGLRFIEMAELYDFTPVKITEVYAKAQKPIERLLIRLGNKHNLSTQRDTLIIHNSDLSNDYTEEFKSLTQSFYLFM
ncbi:MAG: methyltransferase [Saprospiraceae bacterium]|nr:methyltransferase [Saprospiraceae bacterium]